jgi:hypothetical protein
VEDEVPTHTDLLNKAGLLLNPLSAWPSSSSSSSSSSNSSSSGSSGGGGGSSSSSSSSRIIIFIVFSINLCIFPLMRVRDRGVGIATTYGLDDWGVEVLVPVGSRSFSSPRRPDRLWGPPSLVYNGYLGLFPQVKRQGREAAHSLPTSAEVKKRGSIHPLPHTSSCN